MADFLPHKKSYKQIFFVQLIFWAITLLMLFTRFACLYTYNGADDLHYAFLSSRLLNGSYDMFFANDIFSARLLLVGHQALWFKIFGINDFSMSMPSLFLLIILAYFVCFKCGLQKNIYTTVLGSSLIYFNPVVTSATSGNLPDVYIALIAVLVFFLIRKNLEYHAKRQYVIAGIFTGLLLLAGLLIKESIILIYTGSFIMLFYYRRKISRHFLISLLSVFFIGGAGYLCLCYAYTGNAFYHFVQINNSIYYNPCSYNCQSKTELLKRLTITVPFNAVISGAYPLLLLLPFLFFYKQNRNADTRFWRITLIVLGLLALYFPFSISSYVPLCHDMRQFFFLFPFAAILYLHYLQTGNQPIENLQSINKISAVFFAAILTLLFIFTPYNKWLILCYCLLVCLFIINIFLNKKLQQYIPYLGLPVILWFSTAYPIYKKPHTGYSTLKRVAEKINELTVYSNTFYFLNNDTRSHFALICKFDTTKQFLNIDTTQLGFKPFIAYQPQNVLANADSFKKGWLIVSKDYLENIDAGQMRSIDKLLMNMKPYIEINKTAVYYITSNQAIKEISNTVNLHTGSHSCD